MREQWFSQLPKKDGKQAKTDEKHPIGAHKPVILWLVFLQYVKGCEEASPPQRQAADKLLAIHVDQHEAAIGAFEPRYKTPREGRAWLWMLTLSGFCQDSYRAAITPLVKMHITGKIKTDFARSGQSAREKALWKGVTGK